MSLFWGAWSAVVFPLVMQQGIVRDPVVALYHEAMATASAEGLPALVRKLDDISQESPSSPFVPWLQETIQLIALLHPGAVPEQAARLQAMKSQASRDPAVAKSLRRLEIVAVYYAAASRGRPESAVAALSDPVFEGSILGMTARADAALRAGDYGQAETLAQQVIEADPYSPLLASDYVILGLCEAYRGHEPAAARHFRRALAISPLPTIYGNTRDYLLTAYRFARPSPGAVGGLFDELSATRITGSQELKDPRSIVLNEGKFLLADREQILTLSAEGKVVDAKAGRKVEDIAVTSAGKTYYLASDSVDPGTGNWITLSLTVQGKPKTLKKLRSLAVDERGDLYLLDQDVGLLRAAPSAAGTLDVTSLSPTRGHLIRVDRRGNLYVLGAEEKSILVLSKDGRPLTSITPAPTMGKESSIEYFALDALDHTYILDANSIQIFAVNEGSAGLDKPKGRAISLEQRPPFKDLKVIAVSDSGEVVVTGKNEGNWVLYR